MDLKILSLNVRGFREDVKQHEVMGLARFLGIHVLLLQETHIFKREEVVLFENKYKFKSFWSFGSHNSRGVGIIFLNKNFKVIKWERDVEGRVIKVLAKLNDFVFSVVSVYGPNDPEDSFCFYSEELPKFLIGNHECIMGGDFNCILDKNLDSSGGRHNNVRGAKELEYLIKVKGMGDLWKYADEGDRGYTCGSRKAFNRLDRFYATKTLETKIKKIVVVDTVCLTDHKAVVATFSFVGGSGLQVAPWKMNVSLLNVKK